MFDRIPSSYFFENRSSCAFVSRNGPQAGTLFGRKFGARRLELPAQLAGHPHRGPAQHLGIQLVRPALDLALNIDEAGDQNIAVDREPVTVGLLLECVVHPCLPIDQGAVTIERDEFDVFRKSHEEGVR
jgi:hypothetical protein